MKLHEMLISGLFVTVVFMGFVIWYADGVSQYGSSGEDYSQVQSINTSLRSIYVISNSTKSAMEGVAGLPFGLDVAGGVLVGAYSAVMTVGASFGIFWSVLTESTHFLPLGTFGDTLVLFAGAALMIVIFIAILAHFISKSDRV